MYNLKIDQNGTLTLSGHRKARIHPSPLGILVCGGAAYAPVSASVCGETITVHYPCGDCLLSLEKKNGYHKLTLLQVPEATDGYTFGPYRTDGTEAGELSYMTDTNPHARYLITEIRNKRQYRIARKNETI